jgi:uncharacterized membrane protein
MNLAPLLNAAPVIKLHAFAALGALALGAFQFVASKGTHSHRAIGWTWVVLMLVMLVSAFFVHDVLLWGPFSPQVCLVPHKPRPWMVRCAAIHLVTLGFLLALPAAVLHARFHHLKYHRRAMLLLVVGALLFAAIFALDRGRIMNAVVFGP